MCVCFNNTFGAHALLTTYQVMFMIAVSMVCHIHYYYLLVFKFSPTPHLLSSGAAYDGWHRKDDGPQRQDRARCSAHRHTAYIRGIVLSGQAVSDAVSTHSAMDLTHTDLENRGRTHFHHSLHIIFFISLLCFSTTRHRSTHKRWHCIPTLQQQLFFRSPLSLALLAASHRPLSLALLAASHRITLRHYVVDSARPANVSFACLFSHTL